MGMNRSPVQVYNRNVICQLSHFPGSGNDLRSKHRAEFQYRTNTQHKVPTLLNVAHTHGKLIVVSTGKKTDTPSSRLHLLAYGCVDSDLCSQEVLT